MNGVGEADHKFITSGNDVRWLAIRLLNYKDIIFLTGNVGRIPAGYYAAMPETVGKPCFTLR